MDKQLLKSLIVFHKERFLSEKELINREILSNHSRLINSKEIIFITGIRRSGKSSLMSLIAKDLIKNKKISQENLLFINFEDERFINFTYEDFDKLYQAYLELENPKGKNYLFFDEIQNIENWERWINRLYEFYNVKIFITGSNASLISSSVSSVLTGRNRQIQTYTFSFKEYLWLLGIDLKERDFYSQEKVIEIRRAFENYLKSGGFPEVLKNNDITLAEQYFKDIIHRDVISRYNIRNVKEIRELALYLITNSGCIASYDSLRIAIQAKNVGTIKNYLSILEDVYLIQTTSLYDFSVKKQIYNPDKYFVSDLGFYHSVGFKFSENSGRLLETVVYLQLLRQGFEVYYWKSTKGSEVDFITLDGIKLKQAIQVTYSLNDNNFEREVKGLMLLEEQLGKVEKFILTYDDERILENGIKVIPIWKWIL